MLIGVEHEPRVISRREAFALPWAAIAAAFLSACSVDTPPPGPAIAVGTELALIVPPEEIEKLNIGFKILWEAGFNIPSSINPPPDLQINRQLAAKDLLGLLVKQRNPTVYQEYQQAVESIKRAQTTPISQPDLLYVEDDGQNLHPELEFSHTLYEYIMNGVNFRKRIDYAKAKGLTAEERILKRKYFSWQNRLLGEYSINGQPKIVYSYYRHNIVEIEDYDTTRPGIYLRPEPVLRTSPDWPLVFDGEIVVILGEKPTVVIDDEKKQATTFWQVAQGKFTSKKSFLYNEDKMGFISSEWLGANSVNLLGKTVRLGRSRL